VGVLGQVTVEDKPPPFWFFVVSCILVYLVAIGTFVLLSSWWWLIAVISAGMCLGIALGALQFHGPKSYLLLISCVACLLVPVEVVLVVGLP
jgi:hypothetical protein